MKNGLILCAILMATVILLSNILVQYMLGNWLTYGALTYPFAFLINDITNRLYGANAARRVVLIGFGLGILCSFIGTQIIGEFGPLVTIRIALASGTAFIFAQLVDIYIFNRMRSFAWWSGPVSSSLIGSSLDTLLFFSIAFSNLFNFINPITDMSWANESTPVFGIGSPAPLWVSLAMADFIVKIGLVLISLIPFRVVILRHEASTN